MITVETFTASDTNAPGVRVRMTYIEPTHEVVKALTSAGIDATQAFRSINLSQTLEPWTAGTLTEDQQAFQMDMLQDEMLECLVYEILERQSDKLTATDTVDA